MTKETASADALQGQLIATHVQREMLRRLMREATFRAAQRSAD